MRGILVFFIKTVLNRINVVDRKVWLFLLLSAGQSMFCLLVPVATIGLQILNTISGIKCIVGLDLPTS